MRKLLFICAMLLVSVAMNAQRDVTSTYITNADLSNGTSGWTVSNFNTPVVGNGCSTYASEAYAGWATLSVTDFSMKQTITLPAGNYRLVSYSFFRYGIAYNTNASTSTCKLVGGESTTPIATLGSITAAGYANSQAEGAAVFDAGMYRNYVDFTVAADGTSVDIGLEGTFDAAYSWCIAGPFELLDMDKKPDSNTPTNVTYLMTNPSFEYRDLTGWTQTGAVNMATQTNKSFDRTRGIIYAETWHVNGEFGLSQSLTSLPSGRYGLTASAYTSGTGATVIAGSESTVVTASSDVTLFPLVTDGNLTVKFTSTDAGSAWTCVDGFYLKYYGNCVSYYATDYGTTADADTWYAFPITVAGDYAITTNGATVTYTQDGDADVDEIVTTATDGETLTLAAGTLYVKASAATTIAVTAQSYSYVVGTATVDKYYVEEGRTVTVSYADLTTNNTSAAVTYNLSNVTFNGSAVTCTQTANGFSFEVPSVEAGSQYALVIPAGAIGYAAGSTYNEAQTITLNTPGVFDQIAYLYNPKTGLYLSRGNAYGTAATVDQYGIPVNITTDAVSGKTTLQFVDNALYMYNSNWAYGDGADPLAYTVKAGSTDNYTGLIFTSAYGPLYINGTRVANNGIKGDNYTDDDLTIWQVKSKYQRDADKVDYILAMHEAIAAAAGTTITDEDGFDTFLSSYANTEDKTSSVSGASLTGSLDAAWAATDVRNSGTAYTINSYGTEFYQSAETFTQTVTGLDEGVYKVTLNGFFRQGSNANCVTYKDYDLSNAYLQANDYQINLKTWASDRTSDSAPNGQSAAYNLFVQDKYLNELYTYVGSDGNLTLTICNPNYLGAGWMTFENLTLTYYYNETLDEAYTKLATALSECAPWSGTYTVYDTTKSAYDGRTYTSVSAVHSAITALEEAYEEYCKTNYDNDHPYDTGLIKNPSYDSDMSSWTTAANQTGSGSMGVTTVDGDKIFQSTYNTWMHHESVYQEGIVVPAGCYKLSAMMKGTPKDDTSTYIYATDGSVSHWSSPTFGGNSWIGYLTTAAASDWTEVSTFITLTEETTIRVGVISWGNNYNGGNGGAFSVDDWKLEQVKYATEILGQYYLGDANGDDDVSIKDVPTLIDGLVNGETLSDGADANEDGYVTIADVEATAQLILNGTKTEVKDAPVKYIATVYTEQLNSENMEGNVYQLSSAVNVDPSTVTSISEALTTVKVNVSGISNTNIASVSIYAKGKENIAGILSYNTKTNEFTVSNGSAPSSYAVSMASDVVTVNNDNSANSFTAYLLPNTLSSGVTVTVRTFDDTYYTQDFTTVAANTSNTLSFTNTSATGAWMATVPGDIHFNYLSIPGAHDAATSGLSSLGKCQSKNLSELLKAGVRSLDLRPYGGSGITSSTMYINHGVLATSILFKDALVTVKDYLVSNPTETVFILIHDEKGDGADDWKTAVLECIQNVQDYVKIIDSNMTLDDCRGKMVIISRDDVSSSTTLLGKCGWGSSFGDKTVFYGISNGTQTPWTLMYQDNYTETTYSTRLSDVEKLLTDYIEPNATNANRIYVNTTNIAGTLTTPANYASTMNNNVATSSAFTSWGGRIGIISSDFMCDSSYNGDDLFQMIVNQNYKYIYTGRTRK